jgi:hypothetical protein
MRGLQVLVVVMGVMIVAGVAVLGVTLVRRMNPPPIAAAPQPLNEPDGTRIAQVSAAGDRMVLLLQGGGPDRVAVLDLRTGQVLARAGLAH